MRHVLFALIVAVVGYACLRLGDHGARVLERLLIGRAEHGLSLLDLDWAEVQADGLHMELHGHAPDVFARDLALESVRATAPLAVVIDHTTVSLAPPPYRAPVRIELLRDDMGLTLTGRFYGESMRASLIAALSTAAPGLDVHDLTGVNAARPGEGWGPELEIATLAATRIPNAYVIVEPGAVRVGGLVRDAAHREAVSAALIALAGDTVRLELRLREPLRVVAPFVFAAVKEESGAIRIETCTARDVDESAALEAELARRGVAPGELRCPAALGGPAGDWTGAIAVGLEALAAIPAGRFRLESRVAELTVRSSDGSEANGAARAALAAALPEGYRLVAGRAADASPGAEAAESYWMRLRRSPEGLELSGLSPDDTARRLVESYAAARFGRAALHPALAIGGTAVPARWEPAALATLDALASATAGEAELAEGRIALRGTVSGPAEARRLHRQLIGAAPEGYIVETELTVDLPAQVAAVPLVPARCAVVLNAAVEAQPISFAPGSAVFEGASQASLDRLGGIFRRCLPGRIEIGGHTDSQGSTELNQRLSRARAEAVLDALLARGVALDRLSALGYGEAEPVASNETEAGRALNRRIAFKALDQAEGR